MDTVMYFRRTAQRMGKSEQETFKRIKQETRAKKKKITKGRWPFYTTESMLCLRHHASDPSAVWMTRSIEGDSHRLSSPYNSDGYKYTHCRQTCDRERTCWRRFFFELIKFPNLLLCSYVYTFFLLCIKILLSFCFGCLLCSSNPPVGS